MRSRVGVLTCFLLNHAFVLARAWLYTKAISLKSVRTCCNHALFQSCNKSLQSCHHYCISWIVLNPSKPSTRHNRNDYENRQSLLRVGSTTATSGMDPSIRQTYRTTRCLQTIVPNFSFKRRPSAYGISLEFHRGCFYGYGLDKGCCCYRRRIRGSID